MYKAVIVDDEATIVTGLSRLMPWGAYGCRIAGTACSGEEALDLVRRETPDVLFTDIRMPGMDGLSLIAALRSEYPDMQITILSGFPEFSYAQQALQMGVRRYVLKPSKMDELEEALAAMVEQLNAAGAEPAATPPTADGAETAPSQKAESCSSSSNFIIANALWYIEEHYAEKLTLSEVAKHVYVSQWHLSKLIARNTGQSFSDLLNGVRIAKAKQLLADPSLKIWEVGERVGFLDHTHFARTFKKLENQSANAYRNSLTKG